MSFEGFTSALWAQMQVLGEGLWKDLGTLGPALLKAVPFLIAYVILILLFMSLWRFIRGKFRRGFYLDCCDFPSLGCFHRQFAIAELAACAGPVHREWQLHLYC